MTLLCGCGEHNDREEWVQFLYSSKDIQAAQIRQPKIQNHDPDLSSFDFAPPASVFVYAILTRTIIQPIFPSGDT